MLLMNITGLFLYIDYVTHEYYRSIFIYWHNTIIESRLLYK